MSRTWWLHDDLAWIQAVTAYCCMACLSLAPNSRQLFRLVRIGVLCPARTFVETVLHTYITRTFLIAISMDTQHAPSSSVPVGSESTRYVYPALPSSHIRILIL